MEQYIEFVIKNWYLFVALVFIIGLLIGSEVFRKIRGIKTVSPIEALQLMNHQDAVMLDIRDGGEYKEGHIPDARNVPLSALKNRLGELEKFKSKPIIVYCRSGTRASSASAVLKKSGFDMVHNLSGGILAWQNANLPVRRK
jgi:rhodanese-related sulfurtransferase